jgi:hypothetical protein
VQTSALIIDYLLILSLFRYSEIYGSLAVKLGIFRQDEIRRSAGKKDVKFRYSEIK